MEGGGGGSIEPEDIVTSDDPFPLSARGPVGTF